jgi:molybdate transport system ATP-binding protein
MTHLFKRTQTLEQMMLAGFYDSIGLYNQPPSLQRQIAAQWFEIIGMSQFKNKSFRSLSLGQQRVILIVRAVIKHPTLLILDEPLEGLKNTNSTMVIDLNNTLI